MEFSTQTSASLHQIKTAALGVGVFAEGILSPAAELIDRASNGAVSAAVKAEFKGKPNTHLVLRNLPGVKAERVILVGLGAQEEYKAATHTQAQACLASYCLKADLKEAVSALSSIDCKGTTLRSRAAERSDPTA